MPELAEGALLEIVCSAYTGTVGSNPTLSAILCFQYNSSSNSIQILSLPGDCVVIRHFNWIPDLAPRSGARPE